MLFNMLLYSRLLPHARRLSCFHSITFFFFFRCVFSFILIFSNNATVSLSLSLWRVRLSHRISPVSACTVLTCVPFWRKFKAKHGAHQRLWQLRQQPQRHNHDIWICEPHRTENISRCHVENAFLLIPLIHTTFYINGYMADRHASTTTNNIRRTTNQRHLTNSLEHKN